MFPKRVIVGGCALAGKKDLLAALARYLRTAPPTVRRDHESEPNSVFWQADFPRGGTAQFETFYGCGFYFERALARQFASPASAIIYVLRQEEPDYPGSLYVAVQENFEAVLAAAEQVHCSYHQIPWLFVKARSYRYLPDPFWLTEIIPPGLERSVPLFDAKQDEDLPTLFAAVESLLMRARPVPIRPASNKK